VSMVGAISRIRDHPTLSHPAELEVLLLRWAAGGVVPVGE